MIYSDGSQYIGPWSNDKRHGIGMLYFPSGKEVEGEWLDNDFNFKKEAFVTVGGQKFFGLLSPDFEAGEGAVTISKNQ